MLVSMTGYGKARGRAAGAALEVEVQSVNGKFAAVNVNVPRAFSSLEHPVRELVKRFQARGSIYVTVNVDEEHAAPVFDGRQWNAYYGFLKQLKRSCRLVGEITLDHLLALHRQEQSRRHLPADAVRPAVETATRQALDIWQQSRQREGARIGQHLARELAALKRLVAAIVKQDPRRLARRRKLMEQRMKAANHGSEPAALPELQKYDIAEELERLQSHLDLFGHTMQSKESEGKKLNFVVQEMAREAQTMSAKVNDITLARLIIAVKEGIDRIKEQVQNVE
jgi:uncharacterized protein (TIGR00255 family)